MSSQTMATSMVGHTDLGPPERSAMTVFNDAPVASHTPDLEHFLGPEQQDPVTKTKHSSMGGFEDDQSRAIHNLLAHLVGNSDGRQEDAPKEESLSQGQETGRIVTTRPPPSVSPIDSTSQIQSPAIIDLNEPSTNVQASASAADAAPSPHQPESFAMAVQALTESNMQLNTDISQRHLRFDISTSANPLPDYDGASCLQPWPEKPAAPNVPIKEELPEDIQKSAECGQIEAFAKLEFADGNYYITTHSCELGRDVRAYQAALNRAKEGTDSQVKGESSSGRASRPSARARREGESQVKGSVISDRGGFCGMDDVAAEEEEQKQRQAAEASRSSQLSNSSIVKPEDLEKIPPLPPFDYQAMAQEASDYDNEAPAPVTSEHLPPPNRNPLIPIHATADTETSELQSHKSISRRHVRIAWDCKKACFKLHIIGLNGAFLDGVYMPKNTSATLHHGSRIQISGIEITFKLPHPDAASSSASSDEDEDQSPGGKKHSTTPTSGEGETTTSRVRHGARQKIKLKPPRAPTPPRVAVAPSVEGQPQPVKRRGPGRPPKDGISSNREKREQAKAAKLAALREANGGVTPPSTGRTKIEPPVTKQPAGYPKPEKRKYTKRKRLDSEANDEVLPSIEDDGVAMSNDEENRPSKRTRVSRSLSPVYKAKELCTPEELNKPQENYARMIYDILIEIHPTALSLRQIYRQLKLKFPYFVHQTQTEGWQSSVRHNLNQENDKVFEKGQKDGKGWMWKAKPGGLPAKEEVDKSRKQNAAGAEAKNKPNAAARCPPPGPPRPGQYFPGQRPGPPFPYVGGPPPHFFPHGSMPPPPLGVPPGQFFHGQPPPPPPNSAPPYPPPHPPGQMGQMPPPPRGTATPPPNPHDGLTQPPTGPPTQSNSVQPTPEQSSQNPQHPYPQPCPPHCWLQHGHLIPHLHSTGVPLFSPPDPHSPCTNFGAHQIRVFEQAFMNDTSSPVEQTQLRLAFESVRRRLLHGIKESTLVGGENYQERVLMGHVMEIIKQTENRDFVGFKEGMGRLEEEKKSVSLQKGKEENGTEQMVGGQGSAAVSASASPSAPQA